MRANGAPDLRDFLLARIAEDEERARAAGGWQTGSRHVGQPLDWSIHMDRWSPDRVLAECAAKGAIVQEVTGQHTSSAEGYDILRHLAAVYAGHPDYRTEWSAS